MLCWLTFPCKSKRALSKTVFQYDQIFGNHFFGRSAGFNSGYARMLESPIMICRRTVREVFLARECRRTDLSKFRRNITRTFSIVFSVKVCIKRSDCSTVVRDIELVDVGIWWNGMCAPLMMIKEILWLDTSLPHEVRCLLQLPCRFRRSLTLCAYVFHQYLFPPSPV